jgi:hypothetical protein
VIADSLELEDYRLLAFTIPCDRNGKPLGTHTIELNAKSGGTYNHKKLWESEVKNNPAHKPYNKVDYNYYPRGRVDISNNKATIYLNPNLNRNDIITDIKQRFGLSVDNIRKVRVFSDSSEHYQCFIDRD